jgi:hypothetical protein
MSTKTVEKELTNLKQEVASLRSLVISVVLAKVKDKEGEYKPKFVNDVLRAVQEKATHEYIGKGSLLKQLPQVE